MKRHFITGLIILLPLAVTVAVVIFVLNLFTQPFTGFFEHFLTSYSWYPRFKGIIHFLLQIGLILTLFFFTVLLGFLGRMLLFNYFIDFSDKVMHRIPVIKTIYKTSQQVIRTIFGTSSKSFKQVVIVPFPQTGGFAVGLVSGTSPPSVEKTVGCELLSVFVPTTPNPTSGFILLYKKEEIVFTDIKVEDALKYIISCGVISPESPSMVGDHIPPKQK